MKGLSLGSKIVILFFVIAAIGLLFTANDTPVQSSAPDYTDSARYKARALVSGALKAPSTAKFCGDEVTPFQFAGADAWEINGCVDAQNSFGAMIRNNYKVVLTRWGGEWRLAALEIH